MSQPNSQFYQSPPGSTDFDSDYGSLSIESQQQMQRSPIYLPTFSSSSLGFQNIATSNEEYLLNQLLNESYNHSAFGVIMDRNGTIEKASGEVEQFLGLNAMQLINNKLISFVSPQYQKEVCGFFPSANSKDRKTDEIAFRHQKNGQLFKMQFICQVVQSNSGKACVVCVARRVEQGPAFSVEIDRRTRTISDVKFQNNKFNLKKTDFVGKTIDELCKKDKSVLDHFFEPRAQCRADLSFKIQEDVFFSVEALSKDFDGEKFKLDCTYINQEHPSKTEPNNVDRKISNVSDRNSNHQQPNLLIQNQVISNNAFLDTPTSQQFQYQSFQITQQPQMQSSNLFVDNQEFLPIVEEEDSNTPPPKKTRKPRKPRNANGTQNSKAKGRTASAEQSDLDLPSIQNQLDHQRNSTVAGAVYPEFSMTGQPYPTSMISNVMTFNPSFEYANLSSDQFTHSSQLPTIDEQDSTVRKKRQRKPRNNSRRSKSQEEDQLLIGMLNNQAAGSVQTTSGSTFANQSLSFDAGRSASTMSTSQVAYSMQTPINMQPMYNNAGPMNPMQMNGVPYQMNAMAAGQPSQVSWQNNGMMNSSQAPSEFHPMYQSQQNQIQMMYSQQQGGMGPTSLTQSSPVGKKPAAKRKSNQQLASANNAPMQSNKQHFMPNGMPQSNMPNNINGMINAQHYQQFPQSNQMYNQQMMQHAPPMNQQQMIAQQQQMMANGINSPQFSSPATPISYGQKSSEAVRLELRNTLQTRQNANSPSSQPNSTQMPHSVQQNVMPISNEINSRFPSSNEAAPNLLSPPRLSSNSQQQTFGGVQPSAQQNLFNMQQAQLMNRHSGIVAMEKNDYPFSDFDLDQKPPSLFQTQDDLLHNDNTYYDFALLSGRFDLSNLETKSLVEKLLG